MWTWWITSVWAAPPEAPWATVRGSVGAGPSNLLGAVRAGVEADLWWDPQLAVGGRFTAGVNGGFGDEVDLWTLEPLVTAATRGRVRAVGQLGVGVASERVHEDSFCPLGCVDTSESIGPWLPALTGSVAAGIASRRSGTTVLLRLEGDSAGNVALMPTIQLGGVFPIRSDPEDPAREDDRPR